MTTYVVSIPAQNDLAGIWDDIARDDRNAADRQIDRILVKFETLTRQPLIGETRSDLGSGVRSFSIGSYVIFYRALNVEDVAVEIVRVLHQARNIHRY